VVMLREKVSTPLEWPGTIGVLSLVFKEERKAWQSWRRRATVYQRAWDFRVGLKP